MSLGLKSITSRMGYEQITSLSSSTALTVPQRTTDGLRASPAVAIIVAEGAAVRWRDDGVAPTVSVGMPLAVGVSLQYDGDLTQLRFIEQTASAKLNVSYYI